jgi:hypothetical protein
VEVEAALHQVFPAAVDRVPQVWVLSENHLMKILKKVSDL